jgi:hypothetical protein
MGNDNKITEEEKSNQIHKEVMLFLGKELERIHQTSSEQTYNIEKEYAKTRKNHSPFSALMLIGCFLVVLAIAFIITKTISSKNEDISVSVAAFDDLNLKNLLNTVGAAQTNYENAVKKRATIEGDMSVKLKAADETRTNDLFVIESMTRLTKKKKAELEAEADKKYKEAVAAIHEEYDGQLVQADKEIQEYKSQLAEFDAAKVQAAQEKEKALDTERRVKELEQKKIKDQYELRISELNQKLADTQKRSSEDMRRAVGSVSEQYQAEIALLDPKLNDSKAGKIIAETKKSSAADFNGASALNVRGITSTQLTGAMNDYQKLYDDYKYLDKAVAALPQKNSIPSYVAASRKLVNQMGAAFTNTAVSLYNENVELNGKINSLSGELAESQKQIKLQQASYEVAYDNLLSLAKTNAVLVYATNYENMRVYIAEKARYLITENGADAEFKADKTIKGKIFRDQESEEDSFYFVVGNDKNGNRFEVNFEAIVPGTPVKILSK